MQLLVVDTGSSSLKLRVLDAADETVFERSLEWPKGDDFPAGALDGAPEVDAVAHRVVHGGEEFPSAVWIATRRRPPTPTSGRTARRSARSCSPPGRTSRWPVR